MEMDKDRCQNWLWRTEEPSKPLNLFQNHVNLSKQHWNQSLEAKTSKISWRMEETVQKIKRNKLLKFSFLTNRLTGPQPIDRLVNAINASNFSFLRTFPFHHPFHAFFNWFPQFFILNAKGILIFGKRIDHFLSIYLYDVLYDVYDMKFK